MLIAWSPIFHHKLPAGHRFPMEKYSLLPQQLLHEGTITQEQLYSPKILKDDIILQTHDAAYLERLNTLSLSKQEVRKIGFPQDAALIEREKIIAEGTLITAQYALSHGVGFNIAGGTHHAFAASGEGFCLLNDVAIAINFLLYKQSIRHALIIDLDVHQGNGTAALFEKQPAVYTFSMHGEKNYPLPKQKSSWDIALPDGTDDAHYLKTLENALRKLSEETRPDIIFYQAGVDVLASDKLGRLNLSLEGCKQRDKMVFEYAKQRNIPIQVTMGGGYSEEIRIIIEAHANTYRMAKYYFE